MIKVIVLGACGRMGSTIMRLVEEDKDLVLFGAIERPDSPFIGESAERFGGAKDIKITSSLKDIAGKDTVIVDFTHIDATRENIKIASDKGSPMVIGTTGFSSDETKLIADMAKKSFPCVLSPNMSLGVNVLFKLVYETAKLLTDEYNVEIVEIHHNKKKDAPSGTAVKLGQVVAEALGWDYDETAVYERKGMVGERKKKEIGMQTLRAGDVVGEHTVIFGGMGERIELTHRAHSRENFARGAIRAVKWVYNRENGFYTMKDVLGIN
ncbi:MAG: 4-hydroxy-tetrahydrodipicolinate reductase [Proteobacteria bacterium]|nr:4-hydroxy-tetrahydrodipicolinate reductase [Pseudomonadota bacterium]